MFRDDSILDILSDNVGERKPLGQLYFYCFVH